MCSRSRGVGRFLLCLGGFLYVVLAFPVLLPAGTVDPGLGTGIGTSVADAFGDGSNVAISTSVTSVAYEDPRRVSRDGITYFEVIGSIRGIGWGGIHQEIGQLPPAPPVNAFSHYDYAIPFVLRWPADFDGTLVYYGHGFATLDDTLFFDSVLGPDNGGRRYESEATYVSDVALAAGRRHGFFAPNLGGIGRDGEFTALAVEGPFSGEPLVTSIDVPVVRDMVLAAERLLERMAGRAVDRILGTGHSGGALVMQFIGGGVTTALFGPPLAVFTGGNFTQAYDPASGTIFDGFVPLAGSDVRVNARYPATAPMILVGGTADYAAVDMVSYAGRLLNNGVPLDAMVRIYHLANMPHAFAEIVESAPNQVRFIEDLLGIHIGREGDRMAPVVAAALDGLLAWVMNGVAPPPSRIAGLPADTDGDGIPDAIRFPQQGGGTTSLFPYVEDPAIDVTFAQQFELSAAAGGLVDRYARVLAEHQHVQGSLVLPYQSCRLGGYELGATATLVPFQDLRERWPGFGDYNSCLKQAVAELGESGLYDRKTAARVIVTEYIRGLFDL